MTVKMWVIGGVYRWGCDDVRLDEMFRTEGGKLRAWFREHKPGSGKTILCTDFAGISGPTHVPCPICGELKQVATDGLQIDLAEHLMRHHSDEWKKQQEADKPSSVDPGEGWRLLEMDETVQAGDQFTSTKYPGNWTESVMLVGALVEYREDTSFRRRIEPPAEAAATPDCSIDPGAGYRILGKHEALREGDQFFGHVSGQWRGSWNVLLGGLQSQTLTYRRKLIFPSGPGEGFKLLPESVLAEMTEPTDEIWSFVTEEWKSAEHADCNEFKGLPIVRRRRIEQERHENKSDVKPTDRKISQNCAFFSFSGESFAILLTPDGNVSLHRCVPFAGLAMIVERSSFRELIDGRRNCLIEVLLKAGVRLTVAFLIVAPDDREKFSKEFVQAAESAWRQS